MQFHIQKPHVVSLAPPHINQWGPWQFPRIFNIHEKLLVEIHIGEDSVSHYGKSKKWFTSTNQGKTWHETDEKGGILLPDGRLVDIHIPPSISIKDVTLPSPIACLNNYGLNRDLYEVSSIPPSLRQWHLNEKDSDGWKKKTIQVEDENLYMQVVQTQLVQKFFFQLLYGPDQTLWAPLYQNVNENGKCTPHTHALFFRSIDGGNTFQQFGHIPYEPPYPEDPLSQKRFGFSEPTLGFVDRDQMFALLRTTDGNGIGPMYISWSNDGGKNWSHPTFFDKLGVWPQCIRLKNGVTVVGYGRPGLYIRGYCNEHWTKPKPIVEPKAYQTDTCSYCGMVPIDDNRFVMVYSDFQYVDHNQQARKAILSREITVEV